MRMRLLEQIEMFSMCECSSCKMLKKKYEEELKNLETLMYDKIVFLSKEAEEEWNNAPEGIKRIREQIIKENISETQTRIENEIVEKAKKEQLEKDVKFWKSQCGRYEFLFVEQKDISAGYKRIIDAQDKIINDLRLKK